MRLLAVLAVLLLVLWLAGQELMGAGAPAHSPTARQAQGVVDKARRDLQGNEARGQQSLNRALGSVPGSQP